jgi:hypothetical protein
MKLHRFLQGEPLADLDRSVDDSVAICHETAQAGDCGCTKQDISPNHAPYWTPSVLKADRSHTSRREQSGYPVAGLRRRNCEAMEGRVEHLWDDHDLSCSGGPMSAHVN